MGGCHTEGSAPDCSQTGTGDRDSDPLQRIKYAGGEGRISTGGQRHGEIYI